jgi:hypothetical protein
VTVVDERGLRRAAREFRKALEERESDQELRAALEVYDRAVTPAERQVAASYLLIHSVRVDARYASAVNVAILNCLGPELLSEAEDV